MKASGIKKVLLNSTGSVTITIRKVAGLVVQQLKAFWNNWQWVLALVALLYGIFLFYYNSTQATPAKIASLERQFSEHKMDSERRISKIESDYNDFKLTLTELNAKMDISLQDLAIMKGYITGEAHHK
jgi:ABC-type glucose/galactose transport system permease subunit